MAAILDFNRNHEGRIGNQHTGIIVANGIKFLFSYRLCVGFVDPDGNATYRDYDSVTTRRHLRQFQRVFGPGTEVETAREFEAKATALGVPIFRADF